MGYSLLQISEVLLKADKTMYRLGTIAYDNMFSEDSEDFDFERDIIYVYKKAVEYADDLYLGTTKLDQVVERLANKLVIYDYGQLNPIYSDAVISISVIPMGSVLNDLNDVTISNLQNNQILRYNSSLGQWVNVGIDSAVRTNLSFTATLNQAVFVTSVPFIAALLDVYLNGVKLNSANYSTFGDYTITLYDGCLADDIIDVIIYDPSTSVSPAYVPTERTLTINGVAFDLSANRAWTITAGVSSVGLSMPSAFGVANSPITSSGTIAVTALGTASQYIRGDGVLATLPTGGSGGSSVSYYLNGGTAASVGTYFQMSTNAVVGTNTDFTRTGNGLISQFLTDVGDPNRLQIPAGNWNFEMFFSMSSSGGSPRFYVELLKYDGTTFTSIASSSAIPEVISGGTIIDLYLTSLAIPATTLLATDRLALRVYIVNNSGGRTATLHTQDSHLCQIITNFAGGLSALNGLTANTQYFATGTSGSSFNIVSSGDTHTFNMPPSENIYTANGTLTGNRVVTMGAFSLSFEKDISINGITIGRGLGNISTNFAIGNSALAANTTGNNNFAIGFGALFQSTTGANNIAIGSLALRNATNPTDSIAIGSNALYSSSGAGNIGIGSNVLSAAATGNINIGIGTLALNVCTSGNNNLALGSQSLIVNTTGAFNIAVGNYALGSNIGSSNSTAVGWASMYVSTGANNTALGFNSGRYAGAATTSNVTSNNSLYLGYQTRASANGNTNEIVIGYDALGIGSNTTMIGNSSTITTAIRGRLLLGTTTDSGLYQLDVNGTARVSGQTTLKGASALFADFALVVQNSAGTTLLDIRNNGDVNIPVLTLNSISAQSSIPISINGLQNSTATAIVNTGGTVASNITSVSLRTTSTLYPINAITVNWTSFESKELASGNAGGTLNLTGFYFNPTIVAGSTKNLVGFRNDVGDNIFNATSGNTFIAAGTGNLLVGTNTVGTFKLDVNGTARVSGDLTILNNKLVVENTSNNTAPTMMSFINIGSGGGTGATFQFSYSSTMALTYGNGFTFTHNGTATPTRITSSGIFTKDLYPQTNLLFTETLPATIKSNGQATDSFTYIGGGSLLFQNYIGSYDTRFAILRSTGNVIIQNGGTFTDVASARLQINSTTQGFLPPRMTTTERNAISSPATGLIVYQTDGTEGLYEKTASAWRIINGGGGSVDELQVALLSQVYG